MFIFYILTFCLNIKIIVNEYQRTFNDIYSIFTNDTIYLGTDLSYIKINKFSENYIPIIKKDSDQIVFIFSEQNKTFIFNDKSKVHYLDNKTFLFIFNETDNATFYFINIENQINNINNNVFNIYYNNSENITLFISFGENIFIVNYILSFILLLSGCFSVLYGSFHYIVGLIPHFTSFLYIIVINISSLGLDEIKEFVCYLFLFFCFISSILIIIFYRNNDMVIKILYGAFFGFGLFKTLVYYYIFFDFPIVRKNGGGILIYSGIMSLFISSGLLLNLFDVLKEYSYLPCAVVTGSFYLMKGMSFIIGGYFSDIIALKENINYYNIDKHLSTLITYLLIHIIIIGGSFFFQIYNHIENKKIEEEELIQRNSLKCPLRISDLSNNSSSLIKDQPEELIDRSSKQTLEKEEEQEEQEDILNDQED